MGRKPKITNEIFATTLQFIESNKNGMIIYETNEKTGQRIEKQYKKNSSNQATFQEIEYFVRRVLEFYYKEDYLNLSRRTVYNLLERLRDRGYIRNTQKHKGIWAVTPLGKEVIEGRKIWAAFQAYLSKGRADGLMGMVPSQLVAFGWTPEHKLKNVDIVTRIDDPEIVSLLYLMRKSAKNDEQFAKSVAQIIHWSLAVTAKVSKQPEITEMVEGILKDVNTIQIMKQLIVNLKKQENIN
jgi:hypothetical protein